MNFISFHFSLFQYLTQNLIFTLYIHFLGFLQYVTVPPSLFVPITLTFLKSIGLQFFSFIIKNIPLKSLQKLCFFSSFNPLNLESISVFCLQQSLLWCLLNGDFYIFPLPLNLLIEIILLGRSFFSRNLPIYSIMYCYQCGSIYAFIILWIIIITISIYLVIQNFPILAMSTSFRLTHVSFQHITPLFWTCAYFLTQDALGSNCIFPK